MDLKNGHVQLLYYDFQGGHCNAIITKLMLMLTLSSLEGVAQTKLYIVHVF